MNAHKPEVTIIIPVHNQIEYVHICLRSIRASKNSTNYDIIIVDDKSCQETASELDQLSGIRVIRNFTNIGFLRSCNRAALHVTGNYIYFLNSDTEVTDHFLDELLDTFKRFPDAGLVGSKLVYPNNTLQECGGIVWKDGSAWNFGNNDDPNKPEYNYTKEVDYVSGAAIIISRKLFLEVGLFDTRYTPAYYEDVDLAFKIRKFGKKVLVEPKSIVIHHEGKTCGTDETSGIKRYQSINSSRFLKKWRSTLDSEHFPNGQNLTLARDRSNGKNRILVIDHYIPTWDRDAGSRCMYMYLELFTSIGLHVTFLPDNFYHDSQYAYHLEKLGIEILYGVYYRDNLHEWMKNSCLLYTSDAADE